MVHYLKGNIVPFFSPLTSQVPYCQWAAPIIAVVLGYRYVLSSEVMMGMKKKYSHSHALVVGATV